VLGYKQTLDQAGVTVDENLVIYGPYTQQGGYDMSRAILQGEMLPTAIFAGNNFIAVGILRALREAGVRVPEDIALVAFDDLPPTYVIDPFLTVAAQSAYEMGQTATQLLLQRMTGAANVPYKEILLPTRLIVRQSSGYPLGDE
jgi:LacI family transcriptional regulator